jgi:ring-1,2-phenylacetyl-CoA epoxidase subunit PaaC
MDAGKPLTNYLLRLGDNALILSHRLSELIGRSPAIEEELAVANVALDLIGQSRMWLTLAGTEEGLGRDEDKLAYLRDAGEFRNLLLVEQPNGDFAQTTARQFYFDAWHRLLLEKLARSTDARIADIAAKAAKEVAYHLRRSQNWVVTLGDGTEESHRRMQAGIDDLWMYTGEMFETDPAEAPLVEAGITIDHACLREPWNTYIEPVLKEATLEKPRAAFMQRGGRHGVHTEHLGFLLAEMQFLQRSYPNAIW